MSNPKEKQRSAADYMRDAVAIVVGTSFSLTGLAVLATAVITFIDQVASWLRYGTMPQRDVFWAVSDTACEATNWQDKGWEGKDICRLAHIDFTDWVGLNKILNSIFDLHIAVVSFLLFVIALVIISSAIDALFYPKEWHSS